MGEAKPRPVGSEPDFMPRLRRLFADGLPERVARMRHGLEGIVTAHGESRPPTEADLEEIFLASHSLKGTAPSFEAWDAAHDSGTLSELVRGWTKETLPPAEELARAGELVDRIALECAAVAERIDAEGQ